MEDALQILKYVCIFFIFSSVQSFAQLIAEKTYIAFFSKKRKSIKMKYTYILGGRSKCDHCSIEIKWYYLIPIVGVTFSLFRCTRCKHKISKKYFTAELASAIYGLIYFIKTDNLILTITISIVLMLCFIISYIDIKTFLIPTELLLGLLIVSLWLLFFLKPSSILILSGYSLSSQTLTLLSASIWLILFLLIYFLFKNKMGFADVKLVFICCLAIDYPFSIYLPTLAAIMAILFYIIIELKNKVKKKTYAITSSHSFLIKKIPFGPFLCYSMVALILTAELVK